jgi:hypothetical protein
MKAMQDAETDKEWSRRVRNISAATLVAAGLLTESQQVWAATIVAEEILVRLSLHDRQPISNCDTTALLSLEPN